MRLKFLTLNIFNGNFLDDCIAFLKKEAADIFVLQEVYNGGIELKKNYQSVEILKSNFIDYQVYYSPEYFKKINGIKVDSGKMIFSRFPIIKKESVFFAGEYRERKAENAEEFVSCGRSLQHVQLIIENTELNIFNIHGIWGFDGNDNPARLRMSEVIVEQIKDKKNVILAGDFNLIPDTQTIKNIEKHLTNVFAGQFDSTFNLKIKEQGIRSGIYSWKAKDLKGFAVSAVDMVFVSPEIKVTKAQQPRVDVSDHYPLVAELEI